jgi:hypothetical protein
MAHMMMMVVVVVVVNSFYLGHVVDFQSVAQNQP